MLNVSGITEARQQYVLKQINHDLSISVLNSVIVLSTRKTKTKAVIPKTLGSGNWNGGQEKKSFSISDFLCMV